MENNIAPELRFPEFEGEWEEKKLGDIAEISSGGTPKRTQMSYWNGIIPWVSTGLINYNLILETDEYITYDGLINSSAKLFPKGTILMAMYGQGKTRGKVSILGIEASTNQACAALQLKNSLSINFVYSHLAKDYNRIRNIANDGGQQNLSLGLIKSLKIFIPSLSEQTKIATFLTTVDQRINLLEKKKTHLEQYKKGVMQKLFPPKGEQTPEIRFKKEDGTDYPAWEEKKIKELFSFKQGVQCGIEKQSLIKNDGQIRFIRIVDLTKNDEPIRYIDDPGKEHRIYNNDLFMVRYGNAGLIGYNYQGVIANNLFKILPINENLIDNQFYFFVFTIMQRKLEALASSSTMPALNFKSLEGLKLPFPTKKEQQKIASFLSAIDKKIERTQEQIVGMQEWKKGLLQKMFV